MKGVGQAAAVALLRSVVGMVAMVAFVVLVLFTGWFPAFSCSRATILVSNQSGGAISNLVISGSCKERHADVLPTGSDWHTATPYRNAELIRLSFICNGSNYVAGTHAGTNLSGSCGISFQIGSNLVVTSDVRK